ncbi:hypothetical protein DPMN_049477 [Dreissena polymorpha]|uniref:Uncharacterized protein n=1 Tax=Dreissena polymorpha TaxID=45954 RepID=A0A9D4CFM8_DREPO|nr:hypothetical protein DPMN_049477 [Dreissena polymorpha]
MASPDLNTDTLSERLVSQSKASVIQSIHQSNPSVRQQSVTNSISQLVNRQPVHSDSQRVNQSSKNSQPSVSPFIQSVSQTPFLSRWADLVVLVEVVVVVVAVVVVVVVVVVVIVVVIVVVKPYVQYIPGN